MKTIFCFLSNRLRNVGKTSFSLGGIPKRSILVEFLNVWLGDYYHSLRLSLPCLHLKGEVETAEVFSGRDTFPFVSNGCRNISFAVLRLLFSVCNLSDFRYCNSEFLNLFRSVRYYFYKFLLVPAALKRDKECSDSGCTGTNGTQIEQDVSLCFIAVNPQRWNKDQNQNEVQHGEYGKSFQKSVFHIFPLRGLIGNLRMTTKFYSLPRRPYFLGLSMKESKQTPTPRLSGSIEGLSALKMLLNTEPVTRLLGLFDLSKYNSSIFRTLSGYPAALLFIPDRRLYE